MSKQQIAFQQGGPMYCPHKHSGSMHVVQARLRRTRGAIPLLRRMQTMVKILVRLLELANMNQTVGESLICLVMFRNGVQ